jgi:hypothetical protein
MLRKEVLMKIMVLDTLIVLNDEVAEELRMAGWLSVTAASHTVCHASNLIGVSVTAGRHCEPPLDASVRFHETVVVSTSIPE